MSSSHRVLILSSLIIAVATVAGAEIVFNGDGPMRRAQAIIEESGAGPVIVFDLQYTEDPGEWSAFPQVESHGRCETSHESNLTHVAGSIGLSGHLTSSVERYDLPEPGEFYMSESLVSLPFVSDQPMTMTVDALIAADPEQVAQIKVFVGNTEVLALEAGEHSVTVNLEANQSCHVQAEAISVLEGTEPGSAGSSCQFTVTIEEESAVANEATTWSGVKSLFE